MTRKISPVYTTAPHANISRLIILALREGRSTRQRRRTSRPTGAQLDINPFRQLEFAPRSSVIALTHTCYIGELTKTGEGNFPRPSMLPQVSLGENALVAAGSLVAPNGLDGKVMTTQ